jgi:hypothetical protein
MLAYESDERGEIQIESNGNQILAASRILPEGQSAAFASSSIRSSKKGLKQGRFFSPFT